MRSRWTQPLFVEELERREVLSTLMGNQLFPGDNPWNQKITNAPVAANSAALVASIGAGSPLHPDFGTVLGSTWNGIPYNVVSGNTQPKIQVVIDAYADESDVLPIPIPANAIIEGDLSTGPSSNNSSDRHLLVYDQDNNIVYETFGTHRPSEEADAKWHADAEAVWDLSKNTFRTAGWTSADAAGLPILPGLVRPDEVLDQGRIDHALRFSVPVSRNSYVYPASHYASSNSSTSVPRMGERFRLKASVDISQFSKADQVILQALKDYGMIVADNGSPWYISGAPSMRWSNDDLHNLTKILGSNFEAVDLTPGVSGLSAASGAGGSTVTINGLDFSGGAGMTKVYFGSVAAGFQIVSDTQIVATVPSQAAGTMVDITVVSPYGTSVKTSADKFTYGSGSVQALPIVSAISPAMGPVAGGTVVTISGSSFTGASAVTFGTQPAASFTINSDTSITAVAPAEAAGAVDITVANAGGISLTGTADLFKFVAPSSASPIVTGSASTSKTGVNLSTLGTSDWAHWGIGKLPGYDHKSSGGGQISNMTKVGGGTMYSYSNDPRPLTWTDGTVYKSYSNTRTGAYIAGAGRGFTFTVPASTEQRTLTVFVGGWYSSGKLVAHPSDGSSPDFISTTAYSGGRYDREFTLVYRAGSANQTLRITWTLASGSGNVTMNAATLSVAPAAPTGLSAKSSNAVITLSWTAVSGAATYNIYRATTSGGEGSTLSATGVTGTTFLDSTGTPGTTYYYEITAVTSNGAGGFLESTFSVDVSVTI